MFRTKCNKKGLIGMTDIKNFDNTYLIVDEKHGNKMSSAYDFYEDILGLFPRKVDQEILKYDHKHNPQHWLVSDDDIFFAIDYDEVIDGTEFMRRVLKVARKAWVTDDTKADEPKVMVTDFINAAWYDLQYYHWQHPAHFLDEMDLNGSYREIPDELIHDHHDFNWYLKKKGNTNKHVKQRDAYEKFLANHDIHDLQSARDYLENRGEMFGKVKLLNFNEWETEDYVPHKI